MKPSHRIIAALYLLVVAYCLVWVPWSTEHRIVRGGQVVTDTERIGYGWLWSGPEVIDLSAGLVPPDPRFTPPDSSHSRPDFTLIVMRLVVVTVIFVAAILLTGLRRESY